MKIDKELLDEYVSDKRLRVAKHPTHDLFIYNYTKHTEFNQLWDEITMFARGIIINSEGELIAWPFSKFFNMEQEDPQTIKDLFDKKIPFEVFEKMDGFLGIGFTYKGEFIISSRGSFESSPCLNANRIWNQKYAPYIKPLPNMTYVFEIIYPEEKIVVDYDFEDLVLLGARNTSSGVEVAYENFKHIFTGNTQKAFPRIVKRYDEIQDFRKVRDIFSDKNDGSHEGFVVRFGEPYDGFRIKLKYEEYFRLSKILTGISSKVIWQTLKDGKDFNEMLELVPDEFFNWVTEWKEKLEQEYYKHSKRYIDAFKTAYEEGMSKKDLVIKMDKLGYKKEFKSMCHAQYDCKFVIFDEFIWNKIKPEFETAFLNDEKQRN